MALCVKELESQPGEVGQRRMKDARRLRRAWVPDARTHGYSRAVMRGPQEADVCTAMY